MYIKKIIILFFALANTAFASSAIQEKADFLCSQIVSKPQFKYEDYFASNIIAKIPYEYLTSLFAEIFSDDGACSSVKIILVDDKVAKIRLYTKTTSQKFIIYLNDKNLINGIGFTGRSDPKLKITDNSSLETELAQVPGLKSIYLKDFSSNQELIKFNTKEKIALASEFKLYVLNLLSQKILKGDLRWDDKLKIEEKFKSLPSGILQDYPSNSELTLKQFAELMISISDNTATDHLIDLLSREKIERSMFGINSFLNLNTPFLTTMDMFRMRTLEKETINGYVLLNPNEKRLFLENLENTLTREQVLEELSTWEQPKDISQVEWFANTEDVCSVVEKLHSRSASDKSILDILAINTPFIWTEDDANFEYAGYKGGSEPGVMTMTFLLKTKSQKWACLSLGINNEKESLNDAQIMDLYHAILSYAGTLLNK